MPQLLRTGARSLRVALGGWSATSLAVAVLACGRGAKPLPVAPPAPPATPSGVHGAPAAVRSPPLATATETARVAPLPPTPAPTSAVATTRSDPSWASCHRSYKAGGKDVAADVEAMARGCAGSTHKTLVGATLTGKQAAEDQPRSFPFEAKGRHCYRVYARAAGSIEDIDVVLEDSASVVVGQDSTDDDSPVVTEDGEVCFRQDDKATVVVSVGMGKGSYALQIWSD